jgi:hypothetical protein
LAASVASRQREPLLRAAERGASRLEREKRPDASAYALLIRAGIASQRGARDRAVLLLEEASRALDAVGFWLVAAVARRRLGQLRGGEKGRSLVREGEEWMTSQKIRNPVRMSALYGPGFPE